MARFTVSWNPAIQADLARIWNVAPDKEDVRRAADLIDRRLAADPLSGSVELREGLYKLTVPPMRVLFELRLADRLVEVVNVIRV